MTPESDMRIDWYSVYELAELANPPPPHGAWARVLVADMRDRRIAPLSQLPALPRDEIDRNRKATGDRRRFAERRAVLRNFVARIFGCEAGAVCIEYDADGAPRVTWPMHVWVSVSADGPHALLAIANRPVGVDFEPLAAGLAPLEDVLHPGEIARMDALPDDEARAEFLFVWTAKEAYLKARGRGFLEDPARVATRFEEDAIVFRREGVADPATGRRHVVALDGAFYAAACVLLAKG